MDVAGKTRAQIADIVRAKAKELESEQVVVTRTDRPGFRAAATRAELGARPRVKATVDEALEPRSFGGQILSRLGIATTRDVTITFTLDRGRVAAFVRRVTGRANDPAVPARLKVTDDGTGFSVREVFAQGARAERTRRTDSYGLRGMRERAELLGGRVTVTSRPGVGTTVEAVIPVPGRRRTGRVSCE